jgi:hypothetical protein
MACSCSLAALHEAADVGHTSVHLNSMSDAAVGAACRHGPTPAALKEYEAVRLPRAQEVQEGSTSLAKQV